MSADVAIFLDESLVTICLSHEPCGNRGREPGPDCDRRYIYGVGAAVFESSGDADAFRARLGSVRTRIRARSGIANARRMARFARDGWHATDDTPEFADPLIAEIDTDGVFKGHVRYALSKAAIANADDLYDRLFIWLLRALFKRYEGQSVHVIFEASGKSLTMLREVAASAGASTDTIVDEQGKGDVLLAMADYLLYATLNYIGRAEQVCKSVTCSIDHNPPIAAELTFDRFGSPLAVGHVKTDDRWHKMYYAFASNMSSVVRARFDTSDSEELP
jgi:hypothetical protein